MAVSQPLSFRRRRGSRIAPFCLLLASLSLSACYATKADVRRMQSDLAELQARQDSLVRASARQTRALQDSLRTSAEIMRMLRGQISNDIGDVKELLLTVQQLLGQNEQRLSQLREGFDRQQQQQQQQQAATQPAAAGVSNIDQLYAEAMGRLKESPATARLLFQQIVAEAPQGSDRAPDAQFYIGETYYEEKNYEQALKEYELVVSSYPISRRAPGALLRAGVVAEERNDRVKARQYYTKITVTYKNSEEFQEATRALQRLRR